MIVVTTACSNAVRKYPPSPKLIFLQRRFRIEVLNKNLKFFVVEKLRQADIKEKIIKMPRSRKLA